ncbi:putative histone deacetylase complex subunit SAP18 [Paratrimastix pyriformis]|uniref:Histone deacetylase complex subunit SAP18 n=1 Tax=Paratrimastix pyriformis TaxID=342808 RepID=A0ABQ8UQ20_9EUKA|nr:putative histone deacetylase complex subunit SAP18 [Paratrimastix pyriformis]
MSQQQSNPVQQPQRKIVDREKTCPLLLRVFVREGGHFRVDDFQVRGKEPQAEYEIHTWRDATLRELSELIRECSPAARARNVHLSFALVYPDQSGFMKMREVGIVWKRTTPDDQKTLDDIHHQTGDYLSVAILRGDGGR